MAVEWHSARRAAGDVPQRALFGGRRRWLVAAVLILVAAALAIPAAWAEARLRPLPKLDHVVVVVLENQSYADIIDGGKAPFIAQLAKRGANFTHAFGIAHPSQPNYIALFSGSTQGIADNRPHTVHAANLADQLRRVGGRFVGYTERGSPRKHNPWQSFAGARGVEQDFAAFPRDFNTLPQVSFVIPNLDHDMHDGSIADSDAWLRQHLGAYAEWCATTNNLLVLTFDEDDGGAGNRIATIFFGGPVKPGNYDKRIDHYRVLRTIQALFQLPPLGRTALVPPIDDIW
jgi:hypothetical protein